MNKRHPHYKMIVAWAEGHEIEFFDPRSPEKGWCDAGIKPNWYVHLNYRIKPREFEDGAWYPVITADQRKVLCKYNGKGGRSSFFSGENALIYEEDIDKRDRWVGEKIEVTWRDD